MGELQIKNLHVTAADKQILKGVDLHVRPGEFHALMGPNGSGKSTLANAIMGHPNLEVTEGQILFNGSDVTEADPLVGAALAPGIDTLTVTVAVPPCPSSAVIVKVSVLSAAVAPTFAAAWRAAAVGV